MFTFFVAQPLRFFLLRIFLWQIPADWFYWLALLLLGAPFLFSGRLASGVWENHLALGGKRSNPPLINMQP